MYIIKASLANLADAALLLEEYDERFIGVPKRDTPERVAAYITEKASGFWIAYVDGVPAGCVVLWPLSRIAAATECKRLYVQPQFRRRGIADALLDTMEAYARETPAEWIYLENKDWLEDAYRIYIRRGYQPCERFNDNPLATIFLRKSVQLFNTIASAPNVVQGAAQ